MKLPIFQIDAFTSKIFSGNPAAVIPLEYWLDDGQLQAIALEQHFLLIVTVIINYAGLHPSARWICADMPHWQVPMSS
jgi:hypothetical protein